MKGARTLLDTDISKSPFAEVYKYQSINGDNAEKTMNYIRLTAVSPFPEYHVENRISGLSR